MCNSYSALRRDSAQNLHAKQSEGQRCFELNQGKSRCLNNIKMRMAALERLFFSTVAMKTEARLKSLEPNGTRIGICGILMPAKTNRNLNRGYSTTTNKGDASNVWYV